MADYGKKQTFFGASTERPSVDVENGISKIEDKTISLAEMVISNRNRLQNGKNAVSISRAADKFEEILKAYSEPKESVVNKPS